MSSNQIKVLPLTVLGTVLVVFLVLLTTTVVYVDTWYELHIGSKHSQSTYLADTGVKDFNEVNTGIGVMFTLNQFIEYGAGGYDNSYDTVSIYGGFDFHTSNLNTVGLGISAGKVSGYKDVSFYVSPNITYRFTDTVRIKLGYIPADVAVFTLTLGTTF